jgi:hypothetical protein
MQRTILLGLAICALAAFAVGGVPSLSGIWSIDLTSTLNVSLIETLGTRLVLDYAFGPFVSSSDSELILAGFIWQGFGVSGQVGVFDLQADLLFGPSTTDYVYAQGIVEARFAGFSGAFYAAQLGAAVQDGPANGFAIRLESRLGSLHIMSDTEFGARIADDDFDGITIVHAATGLERTYATDPTITGDGFTGQKLSVDGLTFGCASLELGTYFTCDGFSYAMAEFAGIPTGIPWIELDVGLRYELQTKSLTVVPRLVVGPAICIEPYLALVRENEGSRINAMALYAFELRAELGSITVRDVAVLDTARYALTTPEFGSVVEEIAEALDQGHDILTDCWEMLSIEAALPGCCDAPMALLLNVYFDTSSASLFDWSRTLVRVTVPFGSNWETSFELDMTALGDTRLHISWAVSW